MVYPHNIYVICLILTIVCIPTIPNILFSFEPLNHALPTIAVNSQYLVFNSTHIYNNQSTNKLPSRVNSELVI